MMGEETALMEKTKMIVVRNETTLAIYLPNVFNHTDRWSVHLVFQCHARPVADCCREPVLPNHNGCLENCDKSSSFGSNHPRNLTLRLRMSLNATGRGSNLQPVILCFAIR